MPRPSQQTGAPGDHAPDRPGPAAAAASRAPAPEQDAREFWRDRLMGLLAHDLVGSLATLRLMSTLIEEPTLPPAHRAELTGRFGFVVRRLEARASDLFLADHLARGRAEAKIREVAVGTVVRNTVAGLELAGREVRLDVIDVDALADAKQLTSVVDNLVSNAVRHAPGAGPIDVSLRATAAELVVVVADRGPGIPPEARDQVFELFGVVDPSQGTLGGIGLFVVAGVAALHNGRAWVDAREGGGAVFTVVIPRQPVRAGE